MDQWPRFADHGIARVDALAGGSKVKGRSGNDALMDLNQGSSKHGVIAPIGGCSYAHGNVLEIQGAKVITWTENIQEDEFERRHEVLGSDPQADHPDGV